jgi:hypothetical protein
LQIAAGERLAVSALREQPVGRLARQQGGEAFARGAGIAINLRRPGAHVEPGGRDGAHIARHGGRRRHQDRGKRGNRQNVFHRMCFIGWRIAHMFG